MIGKKVKIGVSIAVYAVAIPTLIILGALLFKNKNYNVISIIIALLACVPFFIGFEKGKTGARELVVIAVMTAISVVGRFIFAPIPGFKPVTAIVIITAIAFGAQPGFIVGAMSALVSNIMFGQGPWTPFQMFVWGFIGLLSGLIFFKAKKPNFVWLIIVGVLGGILFSVMMDLYTVLQIDQGINFARYWGVIISSLPFMAIYAISNVVFLLILTNPILAKLNRVKIKYGLFGYVDKTQGDTDPQELKENWLDIKEESKETSDDALLKMETNKS